MSFFAPKEPSIDKATKNRQAEEEKRVAAEKAKAEADRREEQTRQNQQETLQRNRRIGARSLLEGTGGNTLGGSGTGIV
jgi:hypothetical protein